MRPLRGQTTISWHGDSPEVCPICRGGAGQAGALEAVMVQGDGLRLFAEILATSRSRPSTSTFPIPGGKAAQETPQPAGAILRDAERVLAWRRVPFLDRRRGVFSDDPRTDRGGDPAGRPLEVAEQEAAHDMDYRTHFERRMRQHEEAVYRSLFRSDRRRCRRAVSEEASQGFTAKGAKSAKSSRKRRVATRPTPVSPGEGLLTRENGYLYLCTVSRRRRVGPLEVLIDRPMRVCGKRHSNNRRSAVMATIVHFEILLTILLRAKRFYETLFGWRIEGSAGNPS